MIIREFGFWMNCRVGDGFAIQPCRDIEHGGTSISRILLNKNNQAPFEHHSAIAAGWGEHTSYENVTNSFDNQRSISWVSISFVHCSNYWYCPALAFVDCWWLCSINFPPSYVTWCMVNEMKNRANMIFSSFIPSSKSCNHKCLDIQSNEVQ